MSGVTIIVFGITGDLAQKKLMPALYALSQKGYLHTTMVVGCAPGLVDSVEINRHIKNRIEHVDEVAWQAFIAKCYYIGGVDATSQNDLVMLKSRVEALELEHAHTGNRLVHLAIPADYFCDATRTLGMSGLLQRQSTLKNGWHRIVYEKPFGHDLASAESINACIKHFFDEDQIYRIDHYVTKELVANIALLRFANSIFEPLWNNRFVDHIEIIADEQDVVTHRAGYYDRYGALRDMVQNHMMHLIALMGMEVPPSLDGEAVRAERARVLAAVRYEDGILGQYSGYQEEPHVQPDSTTETWACLLFSIANDRWRGVPWYVRTGKALHRKETVIHIVFKPANCLLTEGCPVFPNVLTIRIDPDAGFSIRVNAKKPGFDHDVIPVDLDFCHRCVYAEQTPRPYEVLVEEIILGITSVGVRFDEIEESWRIVDQIRARALPRYAYAIGSTGPKELEEFTQRHDLRWYV